MKTAAQIGWVFIALVLLSGCDKYAEDKASIKSVYAAYQNACDNADGDGAAKHLSARTLDFYTQIVKTGVDAPEKDVIKLPPSHMLEVLIMRNRGKRSELRKLDGKQYVTHAVGKGWWASPGSTMGIGSIQVSGATATAMVFDKEAMAEYKKSRNARAFAPRWAKRSVGQVERPPEYSIKFVKDETGWKYDEVNSFADFDLELTQWASLERVSIKEVIEFIEESESGELKKDVWKPMK